MRSTRYAAALVIALSLTTPVMAADDTEQVSVLAELKSLLDRLTLLIDSINDAISRLEVATPVVGTPTTGPTTVIGSISGVGSYTRTGTEQYDEYSFDLDHFGRFSGTRDTYSFSGWGVWGAADGVTVFRATISGTNFPNGLSTALFDPYSTSVTGLRSFDDPVGYGTAVWTGDVRAYETHPNTFGTPVEGDARLEMDLDGLLDTIDVDFTNFDRRHSDMSWNSVFVIFGGFSAYYPGELEGNFYGDEHEGVAGTFERDGLKGVFGAMRSSTGGDLRFVRLF